MNERIFDFTCSDCLCLDGYIICSYVVLHCTHTAQNVSRIFRISVDCRCKCDYFLRVQVFHLAILTILVTASGPLGLPYVSALTT